MRRAPLRTLGLAAAALAIASVSYAKIEWLDLGKMVAKTDNSVVGTITNREVIVFDHPVDGPELYYTHLTVEGRSLVDGQQTTVVVTWPGGWIDEEHGVDNSEAPSADEVELGNEVVVFYKWTDNIGGDLPANALYASHGGIFQVVQGRKGQVVLGKGEGYAISSNMQLEALDSRVTQIFDDLRERGEK
jgi:hypothetical protein